MYFVLSLSLCTVTFVPCPCFHRPLLQLKAYQASSIGLARLSSSISSSKMARPVQHLARGQLGQQLLRQHRRWHLARARLVGCGGPQYRFQGGLERLFGGKLGPLNPRIFSLGLSGTKSWTVFRCLPSKCLEIVLLGLQVRQ